MIYKELEDLVINNIEIGSLTSEKLLPQMSGSIELYNKIVKGQKENKSKLIILCIRVNDI